MVGHFSGSGISYGKTIIVENGKDNIPTFIEKKEHKMFNVPEIEHQECKGFTTGTFYVAPGNIASGLKIHKFEIEPGGFIGMHESSSIGEFISYVIRGTGELVLVDEAGNSIATYAWKPGDVIVFRPSTVKPNSLHYWKNGPEKTEMLGIEQS